MSRSVLLQLARDSIVEVFQATRTIDKQALLQEHPLLNQNISSTISIYLGDELKGTYTSSDNSKSLLEDIIFNAKKSAFEHKELAPITTSEYLSCQIEIQLSTPDGIIKQKDESILKGE